MKNEPPPSAPQVLTVKQLTTYIKMLFEDDSRLSGVYLVGEISNFVNHRASGHFYFSLKDESAVIKCVMFKAHAQRLRFIPQDAGKVVLHGRVSVYEQTGQYQFYADDMQPIGVGALAVQFEQLRSKLEREGLFDPVHKKPLPPFPNRIGVITSPFGAAVEDIKTTLGRNYPMGEIVLYPAAVQGAGAAESIIDALEHLNHINAVDVIIIARGGGSLEDLMAFNSESLARAVFRSRIPVISGVGHQTDYTICDYVADVRGATPTAAAELAAPSMDEVKQRISSLSVRISTLVAKRCEMGRTKLTFIHSRLQLAARQVTVGKRQTLLGVREKLDALNPMKVLTRGYALVRKDGLLIHSASELQPGDRVQLTFSDGDVSAAINN